MGEGSQFLEILLFAMVAAFLVYRLRSVLGRRHGEERQRPNPFTPPTPPAGPDTPDNVVSLPGRARIPVDVEPAEMPAPASTLESGVRAIRAADPTFNERPFLQGARAAFELIVSGFAAGDTASLRSLLSDDVYDNFAAAIRDRKNKGETLETRISGFDGVELLEARMDGRHAICVVKFTTRQVNAVRDGNGTVIDGDSQQALEVIDIWTFSRNARSNDPTWLLSETSTPN
jgi:predicted lipid-binding transport protein (Tim44 family)